MMPLELPEPLDAAHAIEARVDPGAIATGAAVDAVPRSVPGTKEVVALSAQQGVASRAALEAVVPGAADEDVVPEAAVEQIVSAEAAQHVAPGRPEEDISTRSAGDGATRRA